MSTVVVLSWRPVHVRVKGHVYDPVLESKLYDVIDFLEKEVIPDYFRDPLSTDAHDMTERSSLLLKYISCRDLYDDEMMETSEILSLLKEKCGFHCVRMCDFRVELFFQKSDGGKTTESHVVIIEWSKEVKDS